MGPLAARLCACVFVRVHVRECAPPVYGQYRAMPQILLQQRFSENLIYFSPQFTFSMQQTLR